MSVLNGTCKDRLNESYGSAGAPKDRQQPARTLFKIAAIRALMTAYHKQYLAKIEGPCDVASLISGRATGPGVLPALLFSGISEALSWILGEDNDFGMCFDRPELTDMYLDEAREAVKKIPKSDCANQRKERAVAILGGAVEDEGEVLHAINALMDLLPEGCELHIKDYELHPIVLVSPIKHG